MSTITQKFMGFVNQIAVDLGLMSREQSVEILSMQARFLALAEKGIKPTAKFLDADPLFEQVKSSWQDLAAQNQISETDFLHHYARASSGKGIARDEAPSSGDIAGALKFIPKDVKNAILTAQAAVRAEQALSDIKNPNVEAKTLEDIERQHGRIDYERKFDPEELVHAQINNMKADSLHYLMKANEFSVRTKADEISEITHSTREAYTDAAAMFTKLEIPAAQLIAQELSRAAQEMGKQR